MAPAAPVPKLPHVGQSMEAERLTIPHTGQCVSFFSWRHGMKGSTLLLVEQQYQSAMKRNDLKTAYWADDAREKLAARGAAWPACSCVWAGSDTCRTCPAPESGRCPVANVDVAA